MTNTWNSQNSYKNTQNSSKLNRTYENYSWNPQKTKQ